MMKLTKTGLGLLNAQYKSVLRKCFLINCGLFALGVANAPEAKAEILPTLGENSFYNISAGTEENHNFSTLSYDTDTGTTTTNYYKINLNLDKLSTNGNVTWQEVSEAGDNTVQVTLPNNDVKYLKWTYTNANNYEQATTSLNDNLTPDNTSGYYFENFSPAINSTNDYSDLTINSDFIGNTTAIRNGNSGKLDEITGDFINNGASSTIVNGGDWRLPTGEISKINGSFIGNHETTTGGWGGSILNEYNGVIDTIEGIFIENTGSRGQSISNGHIINNLKATFIGPSTGGEGTVWNYGILNNLESTFIGNAYAFTNYPRSLRNEQGYNIENVKSIFIGNGTALALGGAKVGRIESTFIDNDEAITMPWGGAFSPFIDEVYKSYFNNNKRAIYMNTHPIGKIQESTFIANGGEVNGGALNRGKNTVDGTITQIINSNFYCNYATGLGGAIYTSDSLNIIAENGTSTFQGNYVQVGDGEKDYQAIWVNSAAETLTFATRENGEIYMYDNVNGVETTTTDPESGEEIISRYKVNITGDGTGAMHLYNSIYNADVSVNNTTLEIGVSPVEMKNVTFGADSTLALKVNSLDEYGSLTAENIKVDQGAKLNATLAQGIVKIGQQETLQLLKADNTDFNNFADSFDNNMYHFEKDGKNGAYTIKLVKTAEEIVVENGGDQNQAKAAAAWVDGSAFASGSVAAQIADTLADLAQNKPVELVDNLIVLAPEEAPIVQQNATDTTNAIFSAVGTRLSGGSAVNSQGISSGDNPSADVVLWIHGLANHAKYSANKHSKGFDSDTFGTAMGIEKHIDNYVKFGAGYAYSKTDIDAFMRDTDVKTHTAILYGEYKPSAWFVNAVASYGWSDYDETKHFNNKNIKFNYDVRTLGLQALTGYDFDTAYAQITPQAGMRYLHIHRGGAVDSAEQNISDDDIDVVTAVIGAKLNKTYKTYNGVLLTPEFRAAMTYDISHDDTHATVTLPNGASYNVTAKALNRFGVEVGGGVTAELNDQVEFSLGYEGRFRNDYQDHSGIIGAKYNF